MDIKVEKLLNQEQIKATPKEILEQLYTMSEEKSERYNTDEYRCTNQIEITKDKVIPEMEENLKKETNPKYIKGYIANINHQKNYINECIDELNLIRKNRQNLKKNLAMMAKVLGYEEKE